ncbi:Mannose-6-phosphate isomerase [uncultured archaeon]|nr:Mannose-6-phosphate isomerase [uncultured archaeon]
MNSSITKYSENRPWGNFEQFCKNQQCTVKIISVKSNEELSLQYHHHRDEFWKILSGKATIVLGEKAIQANEGDEFFVPKETRHRIKTENSAAKILEISLGKFDENDIVRLEDKYKRN